MLRHIINTVVAVVSLTALINLLCVMPPDPNRDENAKVKKITIESGVDSSTVLIDKEVTIKVSLMLAYRIDSVVIDFDDGNDTVLMPGEWDTTLTFKHIFDSVGKKVVEATVYTATATPKSFVLTLMVVKPATLLEREVSVTGNPVINKKFTFSVSAEGTGTVEYEWYKGTAVLHKSEDPTYTINSLTEADTGEYFCIVSNLYGSDTSFSYTLTLDETLPPVIENDKKVFVEGEMETDSRCFLYITASGSQELAYQWYKDNKTIKNETSDTLVFSSLSVYDNGVYKCIVTNEYGSDTSLEYTIEVLENVKPIIQNNKEITVTGSLFKDSTVTLSINASGTELLSYSWYKEDSEIVLSTEPELTLENLSSEAEGEYYCIVTNEHGSDTSNIYELVLNNQSVPLAFTDKPGDTKVTAGSYLMFTVEFSGTVVSVQWLKNGEIIDGATEPEYEFQAVTSGDAGEYEVKICNDKECIVSEPFTLLVFPDSVSGLKAQTRSAKSIKVTWNKIAGASRYMVLRSIDDETFDSIANTADTAILDTPLVEGSRYSYRIIAKNNNGSSDTSDIVSSTTWSGPKITSQPKGLTLIEGDALELSVVATGNPDVTYQWIKDGDTLPGATEASYVLNGVVTSDAGAYRVIVSNEVRSVNSDQVTVTVKREYTLDTKISSSGGGTISRNPDKEKYLEGEDVELTAIPDQGHRFDNWTGDVSGDNPVVTIEMDTAKKVTANFVKQFTLTLESSSTSRGSVSPSGKTTMDKGVEISISATPNTGFKFIKWTVVSGTASITDEKSANTKVKLDSDDATVQAEFKSLTFIKKSISISGYESVLPKYAIQMNDSQYLVVADCQTSSSESYSGSIILNHFGDTVRTNLIQRDITLNSIQTVNNGFIADGLESYDEKIIISFSSNGNYKSIKNYNYLQFTSMSIITVQTNDYGYAIMGTTTQFTSNHDFYFVKTDANLDTIWTRYYDNGSFESFGNGIQTSDGGYLLVGGRLMGQAGWVIKTDQNGDITWDSLYSEYLGTETQRFGAGFNSVIEINDGYIVGGNMRNTTLIILKIDFSGNVVWSKTYPNLNSIRAVRQKSNENIVIAGTTNNIGNGGSDIYLVETNPDGVIIGEERTFGTANDEYCNSMELTKDGGILIVGSNGWIIKTDENGNVDP